MSINKTARSIFAFVALAFLLIVGLTLFIIRNEKIDEPLSPKLSTRAKRSSEYIVAEQFLILVDKAYHDKISEILDPLALEVKLPLLNWLLVGKKNARQKTTIHLGAEAALVSHLTLAALLQHPYVLDAQFDHILETTVDDDDEQKGSPAHHTEKNYGNHDVVIAVVDQFSSKNRDPSCHDVVFFSPLYETRHERTTNALLHGDIMLRALGACDLNHAHKTVLAVDRPSLGQADSFFAALVASHVDVCSVSAFPCPRGINIEFPRQRPDILLLPFGGDAPDLLQFSTDMLSAIRKQNIVIVTSAGNDRLNSQNFFPGGSPHVINVGSVDKSHHLARFSNWGTKVDILAQGDDIVFDFGSGSKTISGTSISAAYVASVIASIKSQFRELNQKQIEGLLARSADVIGCEDYCHNVDDKQSCEALCCLNETSCGRRELNKDMAIRSAAAAKNKPSIELNSHYLLLFRDDTGPKNISVANNSENDVDIVIQAFDSNVVIASPQLTIGAKGNQNISISLHEEPYKRVTYKIDVTAYVNNSVVDRDEFYLEYIPKKGFMAD